MNPYNFYRFIIMLALTAYAWVGLCFFSSSVTNYLDAIHPCLIKTATGIPCPSCGTTRSVLFILNGDFIRAVEMNPLGYAAIFILITLPFFFFYDAIRRKNTLLDLFIQGERFIRNRKSAIALIIFFLMLWGWNIHKGL